MHCFTGGLYQPIASLSLHHAVVFVNTRCAIMCVPVDCRVLAVECSAVLCLCVPIVACSRVYSIVVPEVKSFAFKRCLCAFKGVNISALGRDLLLAMFVLPNVREHLSQYAILFWCSRPLYK